MQDKCHTSSVSMSDTFSKLIVGLTAAARPWTGPLVEGFSMPLRTKFMDSSNLGQKHFNQQQQEQQK